MQQARFVILVTIVILMTILTMQNWTQVEVKFFFWPYKSFLSLNLLFTFVLGFAFGWFGHMVFSYRKKKRQSSSPAAAPSGATDWEANGLQ